MRQTQTQAESRLQQTLQNQSCCVSVLNMFKDVLTFDFNAWCWSVLPFKAQFKVSSLKIKFVSDVNLKQSQAAWLQHKTWLHIKLCMNDAVWHFHGATVEDDICRAHLCCSSTFLFPHSERYSLAYMYVVIVQTNAWKKKSTWSQVNVFLSFCAFPSQAFPSTLSFFLSTLIQTLLYVSLVSDLISSAPSCPLSFFHSPTPGFSFLQSIPAICFNPLPAHSPYPTYFC